MATNFISADKLMFNMDSIVNDTPVTADIFLCDFCNNRCNYCSYTRYCEREGHQVFYDDFIRYADRLKEIGVKGFLITGGGEPTICRDFDRICEYMESHDMPYGITTNFNVMKYFKPRFLKVSFDAWDEDSYEQKRGVRMFNQVRKNITEYIKWKEVESPETKVGLQIVLTNTEDIFRFYEANKDLEVDYFTFKPVESTIGKWYKDSNHVEDAKKLKEALDELHKVDSRIQYNFKWDFNDVWYDKCYGHAQQIAMNWDGDVMICCHRPYDIIGNIMDEDILEKNRRLDWDMSRCDVPCRMSSANALMKRLKDSQPDYEFL